MGKTKHVMVDLETLGLKDNCVILQIAAVQFDLTQDIPVNQFTVAVDITQDNRNIEPETLKWWLSQDMAVCKSVLQNKNAIHIEAALQAFLNWVVNVYETGDDRIRWWCLGVNFDFAILDNAFKRAKLSPPWKYSYLADVRTFDSIVPPEVKLVIPRVGLHHNALDDCKFQINYVKAALQYLKQ